MKLDQLRALGDNITWVQNEVSEISSKASDMFYELRLMHAELEQFMDEAESEPNEVGLESVNVLLKDDSV